MATRAGPLPQRNTLPAGGHYSAYQDLPWIAELAAWLDAAVRGHPGVRFLGICFGCQVLARGGCRRACPRPRTLGRPPLASLARPGASAGSAVLLATLGWAVSERCCQGNKLVLRSRPAALGGEVGRNPDHRFVLKVEELRLAPALRRDPAFLAALGDVGGAGTGSSERPAEQPAQERQPAQQPGAPGGPAEAAAAPGSDSAQPGPGERSAAAGGGSGGEGTAAAPAVIRLIQSHGDQVLALPEGARALAESGTARFEVWAWDCHVLAVQVSGGGGRRRGQGQGAVVPSVGRRRAVRQPAWLLGTCPNAKLEALREGS